MGAARFGRYERFCNRIRLCAQAWSPVGVAAVTIKRQTSRTDPHGRKLMRSLVFALALLGAAATVASAQDAIPDLKGTWTGKGKSIVFGNHPHHPGSQTPSDPPRVRDIEATHWVEGQEGRVAWGRSSTAVADTKEPFAWAIASDNKSIVG